MIFFVVAALTTVVTGQNLTLADVYGEASPVTQLQPWHKRGRGRNVMDEDYLNVRDPQNCIFPLEIVICQDNTASFVDDFENMKDTQLPAAIAALSESHPSSTWGVMTFRDKPVWSLGDPAAGDWCVHFEVSLTDDTDKVTAAYDRMISTGGGDVQENQFGCIVAALQSDTPGWSNPSATRVILVVTDAPPHFEGDGYQSPSYNMLPFSGIFDEAHNEEQCISEYYPNPYSLIESLNERQAYLAATVFDGDWWHGLVKESWEWTNSFIGQPPAFVGNLGENSTNFWAALSDVILAIEEIECEGRSTTTTSTTPYIWSDTFVGSTVETPAETTTTTIETTTTVAPSTETTATVAPSTSSETTAAPSTGAETTTTAAESRIPTTAATLPTTAASTPLTTFKETRESTFGECPPYMPPPPACDCAELKVQINLGSELNVD